ncbi:hypothetical protein BSQ38_03055 [Pediococcus damnosus]|nr:hypothetical protein BSQ38_03055 [Pediococcus damnosus]
MKNLQTKNYELHFPVQSDVDILFRYRSNIEIAHSEGRIPDKSRQETAKFLTQLLSKIDAGIVNYWLISYVSSFPRCLIINQIFIHNN